MDIFSALEWLVYVVGFWLFLFRKSFRDGMIETWKGRSGIEHISTFFEIVISTFCAGVTVWVLLAAAGALA